MPPTLVSAAAETDAVALWSAIVRVYQSYEINDRTFRGGADIWQCSTSVYRPKLIEDVRREWHQLSGIEDKLDLFPFHGDYVMRKWIQYRKLDNADKAELHKWLGEHV